MTRLLMTTILALLAGQAAFAHSGGTDSAGCHHDRKRGGYHCHGSGRSSRSDLPTSAYQRTSVNDPRQRPTAQTMQARTNDRSPGEGASLRPNGKRAVRPRASATLCMPEGGVRWC